MRLQCTAERRAGGIRGVHYQFVVPFRVVHFRAIGFGHVFEKHSGFGLRPGVHVYAVGIVPRIPAGGQRTFDAAVYYMDVDDGIVHALNENGKRYLTNASRVIHKGIELASNWQMSEDFNVSLAYSKSKHEYDEYED